MMLYWFFYAVISFALFGLNRILYVINSRSYEANEDFLHTLYFIATIFSLILFFHKYLTIHFLSIHSVIVGIILGVLSLVGSLGMNRGLRYVSPAITNCIIGLNVILPLVIALFLLNEELTRNASIGIFVSLVIISLSTIEELKLSSTEINKGVLKGLLYIFLTFFTWGFLSITIKLSSIYIPDFDVVETVFLMFLTSYLGLTFKRKLVINFRSSSGRLGIIAGLCSFIGTLSCIYAYIIGPLSLVALTVRLSYSIPVMYSIVFLKERVTLFKILTILLTPVAIIFMTM